MRYHSRIHQEGCRRQESKKQKIEKLIFTKLIPKLYGHIVIQVGGEGGDRRMGREWGKGWREFFWCVFVCEKREKISERKCSVSPIRT